jgi:hypothetical protein
MQSVTTGGDGIKIREKNKGKTLYVNFCSHKALQQPDCKGRSLDSLSTADGLEIPLLLGDVRELKIEEKDSICIDAIMHPDVLTQVLLLYLCVVILI